MIDITITLSYLTGQMGYVFLINEDWNCYCWFIQIYYQCYAIIKSLVMTTRITAIPIITNAMITSSAMIHS